MSNIDTLNGAFGFDPSDGHHHFLVVVPASGAAEHVVTVYECPRFVERGSIELPVGAVERVQFTESVWKAVSEQVRAVFNLRLKQTKRKPGKWHSGPNYLAPHYGKELVLLGWALEDISLDQADKVFRNWRGLAPEERWWLYSTANAPFAQNSKKGRGIGWRKALTIALSENPVVDVAGETGGSNIVIPSTSKTAESTTETGAEQGSEKAPKKKLSRNQPTKKKTSQRSDGPNLQRTLFDL
jgi:hypothetical protein